MQVGRIAAAFAFGSLIALPRDTTAATVADRCRAAKLRIVGDYVGCRLQAERHFAIDGEIIGYDAALADCVTHARSTWSDLETRDRRGDRSCSGEAPPLSAYLQVSDAYTDAIASAVAGVSLLYCGNGVVDDGEECDRTDLGRATCASEGFAGGTLFCGVDCTIDTSACFAERFVDHRDGTVTDVRTGLMWEKKVVFEATSDMADDARWHDSDFLLPWDSDEPVAEMSCPQADFGASGRGTASMCDAIIPAAQHWLARINATCFAGYCDWRFPSRDELATLLGRNGTTPAASGSALHGPRCGPGCSDLASPSCGCADARTWSDSVMMDGRWTVHLGDGSIAAVAEEGMANPRAVRQSVPPPSRR